MTLRVHELAKKLNLTSKELTDKLKTIKVEAKSHMSVLTEDQVKRVKELLHPAAKAAKSLSSAKQTVSPPAAEKPKQTVTAGRTEDMERQPGSIESVRKEFLLQRGAAKAVKSVPEPKRAQTPVSSAGASSVTAKRPMASPSVYPKPFTPSVKKNAPIASGISATLERDQSATVTAPPVAEPQRIKKIEIQVPVTVKDLASHLLIKPSELIQRLIRLNIFATINQSVNLEVANKVAVELGFEIEKAKTAEESPRPVSEDAVDKSQWVMRAPIVTFMGHVDHGKTSLLDAIRNTKVASKEAGGITQHIGAYEVFFPKGAVTFLDTPGHEAFTAMRARGARATDVVVLVVAADDGVMPQTIEAIDHAKAAGVPIIVAINKMDLPSANSDRVKKSLMDLGLMAEEWGGKTVMIGVSAKTGNGIDELLEMLALESELLELRANPEAPAHGVVIEAEISKESGVLATVLVQDGTLNVGDVVIVGSYYCRVRAMINDRGQRIREALPSMPVAILGLSGVPRAGDRFYTVKDERKAKEIMEQKTGNSKEKDARSPHISLEHLFEGIQSGKVEELKLIIKADVQGSLEALRTTLDKIPAKNVRLNIIHPGVGDVSESDVMLAAASDAVIIGFHVAMSADAKQAAETEKVDVRFYEIIYEVKAAIEKSMEGLLLPELQESFVGSAEVRQVFKVSKIGTIAGSVVQKGKIIRNFPCRVLRNGVKVHEGKITSLKRFKDDAREVLEGFECGIGISNFDDLMVSDRIEVFEVQEKARKLE